MYILCTRSQVRVQDTLKTYKFYKLWNHLRKVGIEVIRGVKVEGARHQVRRQRRPVQAARVVCPPRWTEVLGTKEQEEKTPEKSQVVILNTKLGCGGNSLVNKPWHTNKSEQGDKNNDKRQNALVFHVLTICDARCWFICFSKENWLVNIVGTLLGISEGYLVSKGFWKSE